MNIINNTRGGTILEYALICGLIALVALAAIGGTGLAVSSQFQSSALALKGGDPILSYNRNANSRDEQGIPLPR